MITETTAPIPIGSLVKDHADGSIGIIVGPLEEMSVGETAPLCRGQRVLWPSNDGVPMDMDLSVIKDGLIEVISESR